MSGFIRKRLLDNNAALVQMLGLCPLLAVSNTAINALGLGLATLCVIMITNVTVSAFRKMTYREIRIPLFVIIIASTVSSIEMLMNAYLNALYTTLGIFIPLIVTNCMIMARAEAFASRNAVWLSLKDGFFTGVGFLIVLLLIGSIREVVGQGSLFSQAEFLLGEWGHFITIQLFDDYQGFLIAILPPGAFFTLALLVALKNKYDVNTQKKNENEAMTISADTRVKS